MLMLYLAEQLVYRRGRFRASTPVSGAWPPVNHSVYHGPAHSRRPGQMSDCTYRTSDFRDLQGGAAVRRARRHGCRNGRLPLFLPELDNEAEVH